MLISKGKLELVEETLKEDGRTPLNCYKFIYDEMPCCPDCGAPMHERSRLSGKEGRSFTDMDGTPSKVEIHRVVCDNEACYTIPIQSATFQIFWCLMAVTMPKCTRRSPMAATRCPVRRARFGGCSKRWLVSS